MNSKISNVLERIDAERETQGNRTWNITPDTGAFLNTFIREHAVQRILEIGTSTGYSAIWMAEALIDKGGELVTIESYEERFNIAKDYIAEAGLTNIITQIKGHAPEIIPQVEGTFDLIFFDATKLEHVSYFKACEPLLNPKGTIITDNVISHKDELKEYITFVQQKKNFSNSFIDIGTGLMISTRQD